MALSQCNCFTDLHQRELTQHGSVSFPFACYHDDLPLQTVPWHWHEEWEFAIVSQGTVEILLENTRFFLHTGEGIFINSRALHAAEPASSERCRLHSAVFHPRLVGGSADSFFHQTLVQPLLSGTALRYVILRKEIPWQASVLDLFQRAWTVVAREQEDFENSTRYYLSRALRELIRQFPQLTVPLTSRELQDASRIRSLLEFVEDHYREELTLEDIARSENISVSACLRCFHKMLGTTPVQYLKQLRLGKAAEQLQATRHTVQEIALDCGFNDVSYFTRAFRQRYRQTPKAYRQARQTP